ncbi:MAG: sigma 54-interacting transcriptional regulator [Syntrophomonadaceae bacterium]|nr:sigma 54-interacting transcriptional regulator [Syntrophomonadaceae bacterium]
MKVSEIMSPKPLTLKPDQTVGEVVTIFLEQQIDGAPVVDEQGQLVGLFTKSHVYRSIINNRDIMNTRVEEMMTRDVYTGHPDDEFGEVVNATVPRLPVIDEHGRVVGMLTRGDIAKAFFYSYNDISLEYDTVINSAYNMIISIDAQAIIRIWNSAAEEYLGINAEDALGKNIAEVLPGNDLINILASGQSEPVKKVNLDGRWFMSNRSPIKKSGKIIGAVAVLQDISDIEKMSGELNYVKELNEELDAIVESSFDGLFITDGKGNILRYNKAFEQLTGISAHEYLGRTVEEIKINGVISDPVTWDVLEQGKSITAMQESGTGKLILTTGNPVCDENGRIIRVVCNVRDITELTLLKQELEKVQELSQHYESQLRSLKLHFAGDEKFVFTSSKMGDLVDMTMRVASVDATVLITGESGTGKELVADLIHSSSARANKPLIKINCGAIPESLLESELFGYEEGAFTGAKKEGKRGHIELAAGGTLFLDEVGEVAYNLQAKLLRFLQEKEITRIGGEKPIKVDVRIIAATNRDLFCMVQNKEFREDLFYRLNVIPLHIPPLRDRTEDIPVLVAHFAQVFNRKYNLDKRISPDVIDILMRYDWPGNVRELTNLIERIIVIADKDSITREDLPVHMQDRGEGSASYVMVSGIVPLKVAVESVEKQLLEKVYGQNQTTRVMAKQLDVNASTLVRKAAKYNIARR